MGRAAFAIKLASEGVTVVTHRLASGDFEAIAAITVLVTAHSAPPLIAASRRAFHSASARSISARSYSRHGTSAHPGTVRPRRSAPATQTGALTVPSAFSYHPPSVTISSAICLPPFIKSLSSSPVPSFRLRPSVAPRGIGTLPRCAAWRRMLRLIARLRAPRHRPRGPVRRLRSSRRGLSRLKSSDCREDRRVGVWSPVRSLVLSVAAQSLKEQFRAMFRAVFALQAKREAIHGLVVRDPQRDIPVIPIPMALVLCHLSLLVICCGSWVR